MYVLCVFPLMFLCNKTGMKRELFVYNNSEYILQELHVFTYLRLYKMCLSIHIYGPIKAN